MASLLGRGKADDSLTTLALARLPCAWSLLNRGSVLALGTAKGLADPLQELVKPGRRQIEALASLDAFEGDGAEHVTVFLVVAHDAALTAERAVHSEHGALPNERAIGLIGRGRAREVAALLHQRLLCTNGRREVFGKVLAHIHSVELDVAECIPRHLLAFRLELLHNVVHACTLGDEDVHAVILIHNCLQALGFRLNVDVHLGEVDCVHCKPLLVHEELGQEIAVVKLLHVLVGSCGCEPTAIPTHDLVDDEHARVGR
mmetsp:Transcript_28447/g.60328  ORF Transcript_28447/g.60328 Transcript_28447/m.60328 type:complete len:259 (+) Transcript_28447:457-1233(+)